MLMTTPDFMIKAHDLRRTFGSKVAVGGISFSVRRGEIFGLLGLMAPAKRQRYVCSPDKSKPAAAAPLSPSVT